MGLRVGSNSLLQTDKLIWSYMPVFILPFPLSSSKIFTNVHSPCKLNQKTQGALCRLVQKAEEGTLPNSFEEASFALIPKSSKDIRKLQSNTFHKYRCKNP